MPALAPYLIEPIWQQFEALLPERRTDHPLGCHRSRIPERVVFEKLVQVLVFGCAYERIADASCSESTLRRRRDEWIELGLMERLRQICLEAYDRLIGLELSEVAVDGCITKAPCGGRRPEGARWIGAKEASSARRRWTRKGIPLGAVSPRPTATTRRLLVPTLEQPPSRCGGLPEGASVHLDRGYDSRLTRERLRELGLGWEISGKGKPAPYWATNRWVVERTSSWHNAHKKLVWCTERVGRVIDFWVAFSEVVIIVRRLIREGWTTLPLGGATIPTTMSPIDGSSSRSQIRG